LVRQPPLLGSDNLFRHFHGLPPPSFFPPFVRNLERRPPPPPNSAACCRLQQVPLLRPLSLRLHGAFFSPQGPFFPFSSCSTFTESFCNVDNFVPLGTRYFNTPPPPPLPMRKLFLSVVLPPPAAPRRSAIFSSPPSCEFSLNRTPIFFAQLSMFRPRAPPSPLSSWTFLSLSPFFRESSQIQYLQRLPFFQLSLPMVRVRAPCPLPPCGRNAYSETCPPFSDLQIVDVNPSPGL